MLLEDKKTIDSSGTEPKTFFGRPLVWVLFTIISVAAGVFAFRTADSAFPLVTLDIEMDRAEALEAARRLAAREGWAPEGYEQAASFSGDPEVQDFVELRAGGPPAFKRLLEADLYEPYTWTVRHFEPEKTTETWIYFTPGGKPYGFDLTLPEDAPGASLSSQEARDLAEREAGRFGVDLAPYDLVEDSENRQDNRVDHEFTYERKDRRIGQGRYRLSLSVAGGRFSGYEYFIDVPDSFHRQFDRLQSFHEAIAFGAEMATGLLFVLGGCGLGFVYLLRRRSLLWRGPVKWGLLMGLLTAGAELSQLPLRWMDYDTSTSKASFLMESVLGATTMFVGLAATSTFLLMIAEGLTRHGFGNRLQLWRLWSKPVASTKAVLGRTVAPYLFLPIDFALLVAFYAAAGRYFGWYVPSSALVEPDLLAGAAPWLPPLALSLQAGVLEEALFRAIPIAGAALLGERFGRRKLFVIIALVVQAVVFAGAHATYPGEPSYSRLVELFVPALVFGLIYIRFGLLPGIILHFSFDVVFMAMPLFAERSQSAVVSQGIVAALTLTPLWVVGYSRLRSKAWRPVEEEFLNRSWQPAPPKPGRQDPAPAREPAPPAAIGKKVTAGLAVLGLAGLIGWVAQLTTVADAPPLEVDNDEARQKALAFLESAGVDTAGWQVLTSLEAYPAVEDDFVWQTYGPKVYEEVLGKFLMPPVWNIRLVRFEGGERQRSEEHQVYIDHKGKVWEYMHTVPENAPGAELSREQARTAALAALEKHFGKSENEVSLGDSSPSQQPNRMDWTFEFLDRASPLDEGEARYVIELAGDQVVDAYPYVLPPEAWERSEQRRQSRNGMISSLGAMLLFAAAGAALVTAIVSWTRKRFSRSTFLVTLIGFSSLSILAGINALPDLVAQLETTRGKGLQLAMAAGSELFGTLAASLAIALVAGWLPPHMPAVPAIGGGKNLFVGTALGIIAYWAGYASSFFVPHEASSPYWPLYDPAASLFPIFGNVEMALSFAGVTVATLTALTALHLLSGGWSRRRLRSSVLVTLLCFGAAAAGGFVSLAELAVGFATLFAFVLGSYLVIFRTTFAPVIPAVATFLIMGEVEEGLLSAYPGSLAATLFGIAAIIVAAAVLGRYLRQPEAGPAADQLSLF